MIETRFAVSVKKNELHELSYSQKYAMTAAVILIATILGAALSGWSGAFAGFFLGVFGTIFWLLVRIIMAPKNHIETLLKSNGVTVWGYNRQLPESARPVELFTLPLSEITACESGRAMELFGTNFQLGAYKAVPSQIIMQPEQTASDEIYSNRASAIYLRTIHGLTPVFVENISSPLSFALVKQVNRFLDAARALNSSNTPPSTKTLGSSQSASDTFDG